MNQFPSAGQLASWAGVCPGNNESAGKQLRGNSRQGNRWLRAILNESAWASSCKKNSRFEGRYHRLSKRIGGKRAIVAVTHNHLVVIYHVLQQGIPYRELRKEDAISSRRVSQIDYHRRCLDRLERDATP